LTNIGFIIGQVVARGDASGGNDPRRYVASGLADALNWLAVHAEPDAVIFSSYLTGNIAPSMTGRRVYLGHYGQTLQSDEKGESVTALYRGELSDDAACSLFERHRVSYLIYGPFEQRTSERFEPPRCVKLIRSFGQVHLFKVSLED
jgi:hypothetical protein